MVLSLKNLRGGHNEDVCIYRVYLIQISEKNHPKSISGIEPQKKTIEDQIPGPSKGCQLNPKEWRFDTL